MYVAYRSWGDASEAERQKNGNPPAEWPKESFAFDDAGLIQKFIDAGFRVLPHDEFESLKASLSDEFNDYLNGYLISNDAMLRSIAENEEKIQAGKRVLVRFKMKNLSEGITWAQAVWLHHRVKNWVVNVTGVGPVEVDLYNVLNSGDLESAVYMILSGNPDDMTKPYHWVTPQRMQWVASEIQKELQGGI